jgi:hypothetical protein
MVAVSVPVRRHRGPPICSVARLKLETARLDVYAPPATIKLKNAIDDGMLPAVGVRPNQNLDCTGKGRFPASIRPSNDIDARADVFYSQIEVLAVHTMGREAFEAK